MELNSELIEAVVVAIAALIGGASGLALTALILKYAAKWFKDFRAIVVDYTPAIAEQVSNPNATINVRIDAALDRVFPYDWNRLLAQVLPALLNAFRDAIAGQEPPGEPPAVEVNIGDATHH